MTTKYSSNFSLVGVCLAGTLSDEGVPDRGTIIRQCLKPYPVIPRAKVLGSIALLP
jgi:hypothetical protein